MRLLVLSSEIYDRQHGSEMRYTPPFDVLLDVGNLASEDFQFSVFDYDVSIVIIQKPPVDLSGRHDSKGYGRNLPKLLRDSRIALQNGRSVICLPDSPDFSTETAGDLGPWAYEWVRKLGVTLQGNVGHDISASGGGKAQAIEKYLKYAPTFQQIVLSPEIPVASRLAVVSNTEIVVGCEHQVEKAWLVILPPPLLNRETYIWEMSLLVDVARRYYEKARRSIPVGDAPDWLQPYLAPRAKEVNAEIAKLTDEKVKYDRLVYALYGTGDALETSVALLLSELGLTVNPQPRGSNIDLKAALPGLGMRFAIEVTGTKGTIQKDSQKIGQAWQYLNDRMGTPEERDKLIVIANTEYHLKPSDRGDAFTENVVKLLGDNGILLMTTSQLYDQCRSVHEKSLRAEDVVRDMYAQSGLYRQLRPG